MQDFSSFNYQNIQNFSTASYHVNIAALSSYWTHVPKSFCSKELTSSSVNYVYIFGNIQDLKVLGWEEDKQE